MKTQLTAYPILAASLFVILSGTAFAAGAAAGTNAAAAQKTQKIPETQLEITPLVENIRLKLNDRLAQNGMTAWTKQQIDVYKIRYPFVVAVWHGVQALPGTTADGAQRRLVSTVELYADYEGRRLALLAQVTDNEGNPMPDQQRELETAVDTIANVEQMTYMREHPGVMVDEKMDRDLQITPLPSDLPEM